MSLDIPRFKKRVEGANLYKPGTMSRKLSVLGMHEEFLEREGLEPGVMALDRWVDELLDLVEDSSVLSYTYDVLAYFDVMLMVQDEKLVELLRKRLPKLPEPEPDYLTVEEFTEFMSAVKLFHHWLIFAILYEYSRRPGEVVKTIASTGLLWDDIDFENDTITFNILKKNAYRGSSTERATYKLVQYIKDPLLRHRKRCLPSQRGVFKVKLRAVEYAFKRACDRAGIESDSKYIEKYIGLVGSAGLVGRKLSPKILRHSRVTHSRADGVPIDVVSKVMVKHARVETTMRFYRAITPQEVADIPSGEKHIRKR